jgi:primary-amine oxidase
LEEPPKDLLVPYLEAEHRGELNSRTRCPPRLARVLFDAIGEDYSLEFCDSVVDVVTADEASFEVVDKRFHSPMNAYVGFNLSRGMPS